MFLLLMCVLCARASSSVCLKTAMRTIYTIVLIARFLHVPLKEILT